MVDAQFHHHVPDIHSVLRSGSYGEIVIEVQSQRDADRVRGMALTPPQGLSRGASAEDKTLWGIGDVKHFLWHRGALPRGSEAIPGHEELFEVVSGYEAQALLGAALGSQIASDASS